MTDLEIRPGDAGDLVALEALYAAAFPDEDLLPLVRALLAEPEGTVLSLVAVSGHTRVGQILFTRCGVEGQAAEVALLGPLAIMPDRQQSGIGSLLIAAGLERLESCGISRVLVLGDPDYYGRFGFAPDADIVPPYRLPDEWRDAWQSRAAGEVANAISGRLQVPAPWGDRALWLP